MLVKESVGDGDERRRGRGIVGAQVHRRGEGVKQAA